MFLDTHDIWLTHQHTLEYQTGFKKEKCHHGKCKLFCTVCLWRDSLRILSINHYS
jgi:hypothetical protein